MSSITETAKAFFAACEAGKGWDACKSYCTSDATFAAQAEPLAEIKTLSGMRVTVGMIVGQIRAGLTMDQLVADYPYLERDDILEALRYAAWRAQEREIALADTLSL